jgi:hypothetical protein
MDKVQKKEFESVNFSYGVFSLLSSLDDAGLGLATLGPVQSKWLWRSPVWHFTFEFKTASHI